MTQNFTTSVEEEMNEIKMTRPHVVILGAGASRAVCPNGDSRGNRLPLMSDFSEIVGLEALLSEWGLELPRV